MLKLTMLMLAVTIAVWPTVETFGGFTAVTFVYGFFAGGFPSLPPTIVADFYGAQFKSTRGKKKFNYFRISTSDVRTISYPLFPPPRRVHLFQVSK